MTGTLRNIFNVATPVAAAFKLLQKAPAPLKRFGEAAVAGGFGADQIIGFLRDSFSDDFQKTEEGRLRKREQEGNLTSQEKVLLQKMGDEESIKGGLEKAASLGAGLVSGGLVAGGPSAIIESLKGLASGGQVEESVQNPIRQLYPDLADAVESAIPTQGNPLAAGAIVKAQGKFNPQVNDIEQQSGMLFEDLVGQVYGGQASQGQRMSPEQSAQVFRGVEQPQQASQGGMSAAEQAFLAELTSIMGG